MCYRIILIRIFWVTIYVARSTKRNNSQEYNWNQLVRNSNKTHRGSALFLAEKSINFSLSLSLSFSLPLFSLRRGARYSLFDKSTSISSLREHQLQDSSRDINLLSRRNVISRAIDTLVAETSNTKTIAGSSLINKKEKKREKKECMFKQLLAAIRRYVWRLAKRNLLSRIWGVPDSESYFFSTTDCLIIFKLISSYEHIET